MENDRYNKIINSFFTVMLVLTLYSLFRVVIWLSAILSVLYLILILLHIRDYRKESQKGSGRFTMALVICTNFLLANLVVIISEFVYPF